MKRSAFIKRLLVGAAAVAVAPSVLAGESSKSWSLGMARKIYEQHSGPCVINLTHLDGIRYRVERVRDRLPFLRDLVLDSKGDIYYITAVSRFYPKMELSLMPIHIENQAPASSEVTVFRSFNPEGKTNYSTP